MPETGPQSVIDLMEEMEGLDKEHQNDQAKKSEISSDDDQVKADQHHHGHQMDMTDTADKMDHSAHSGHGQTTLQHPAPFVKVVDGTGDHHHH